MINMKRNILLAGFSIILACFTLSCADNTDDNLPDSKVYIVNGGEQGTAVTLYDTGEKDIYNLHLYRSGKYGNAANVKVKILSQAEVDVYNQTNGTDYMALPASAYSLLNTDVTYSGKDEDVDRSIQIEFDPTAVKAILGGSPATKYAVPVQIENASVGVNDAKNTAFVRPSVKNPIVYMGLTGFTSYSYKTGEEVPSISMELPVKVDFKNLWDITCDIVASQKALDEYNNNEGTFYTLLPAATYTLDNQVIIKNGEKKAISKLNIDGTKITYGNYCLPIALNSVSKFEVDATKDTYLIGIFIEAPKLDRTGWQVVDRTSVYINSSGTGDGAGVNAILDGNIDTYWHSNYGTATPDNPSNSGAPQFLVIDMTKEYTITQVDIARRTGNIDVEVGDLHVTSDDVPALVAAGQRDQIKWTQIGKFTFPSGTVLNGLQPFGTFIKKGRYLKVDITKIRSGRLVASLAEVEVHGF